MILGGIGTELGDGGEVLFGGEAVPLGDTGEGVLVSDGGEEVEEEDGGEISLTPAT